MTRMAATTAYWRRLGRALIVGGLGCALAGAAFLLVGPARVSGIRIAFAVLILVYGATSVVVGVILRIRHRGAPDPEGSRGPD
jgi:threonine/homoserine efflux transporter RhtA